MTTTAAETEYLKQFKKQGWKTQAQHDKFQAAEALVGSETMLKVVAWAAGAGVSDVNRIYTAASRWQDSGKGHNSDRNQGNAQRGVGARKVHKVASKADLDRMRGKA